MYRFKDVFDSRWSSIISGAAVLAVGISAVRLERFPEWDEAVFLSQSGGLNGIEVRPSTLAASREIGTPKLIGLIRLVAETLANTRLLWIAVSIGLLVTGAVMISRHVRVPASVLVFGFGSYWLSLTFMASFYGFFIAATAALISAGCYLALRADGRRQMLMGVALGASLSLTMWFRQIEGLLVAASMLGHAVVVSPRVFWRLRWRGTLATLVSGLALFVVPWVVDTTMRYGSVGARIRGGSSQDFERGFVNNVSEYWRVLRGHSAHYANLGAPPRWATGVVAITLITLFAVGLFGVARRRASTEQSTSEGVRIGAMLLLWTVAIVLTAFFLFFIGTVRDRYLLIGLLFLSTVVLVGVWRLIEGGQIDRRLAAAILGCIAAGWVVPNVVIATAYENGRFENGAETQHFAEALHRLAAGGECVGVSRFAAPTIQFGSGCLTGSSTSAEDASERAADARAPGRLVFVWWPKGDAESLDLDPEDWTEISESSEGNGPVVVLWSDQP